LFSARSVVFGLVIDQFEDFVLQKISQIWSIVVLAFVDQRYAGIGFLVLCGQAEDHHYQYEQGFCILSVSLRDHPSQVQLIYPIHFELVGLESHGKYVVEMQFDNADEELEVLFHLLLVSGGGSHRNQLFGVETS
jgi:hypothetical protein